MTNNENRLHIKTLAHGLKLYKVKLVGGPADGTESICSHDIVFSNGNLYVRGFDDRYYYQAEGAGRN